MQNIIILGINGHIGNAVARAFVAAGYAVTGFGRSNRHPIPGVTFIKGDAEDVAQMRAAIGDTDLVVNALNLPYHQWDKGRKEAQTERVIAALLRLIDRARVIVSYATKLDPAQDASPPGRAVCPAMTRGSGGDVAQDLDELGDLAALILAVARDDRVLDAMRDVILQDFVLELLERRLHRLDLVQHVDAIAVLGDHARDAAHLAFDAA